MSILKKIVVALLGGAVLLAGLAMIVLPGPAVVVIPAALAILAVEFMWARRWLDWLREYYKTFFPRSPVKWFRTSAETGVRVAARVASRANSSMVSRQ